MNFITLTKDNIDDEHICCAFSDKKSIDGYKAKKDWLKDQIDKGYVFTKLDERAKVFIEYGPSEITYLPVNAPNYMVINCFWVSGKYKKHGYGKTLLEKCIEDSKSKGKDGVLVLCSDKKRPFMSDKKFFLKAGFQVVDNAQPYFELMLLKFNAESGNPTFIESSKLGKCDDNGGFKVYYSNQCPYMNYYIDLQSKIAEELGIKYESSIIDSKEKSLKNPSPFTIYSLFYKGEFITQELSSEKKFRTICDELK
ncbi:MAG: GNAT family N-acetyltransferase [Firmicutes bacterium]|jgi:ribosomal protein S18 acetylase RimI-like enzyme|nr:GNAT family N-acetyltransferase [Bacillota bacterium]